MAPSSAPQPADHRRNWTFNDIGQRVPRRTRGSIDRGYTSADFGLVCRLCGDDYSSEPELPIGVVEAHFNQHHDGEKVVLDLLWLGQGPSPEGRGR